MYKEYYEKLKEAAPEMMKQFCNIYGYTEFEGEYYSCYLISATKPKSGVYNYIARIKQLQKHYDVNLEPFKLELTLVIGHLEANKYIFDCSLTDKGNYSIKISKHIRVETDKKFIEYALQDASIVAAKHLEKKILLDKQDLPKMKLNE